VRSCQSRRAELVVVERRVVIGEDEHTAGRGIEGRRRLRGRGLRVFLMGELVAEPVDHPVIRPSGALASLNVGRPQPLSLRS
jgi:hypothetical protein